jgi:hypothetical protein
MGDFSRSCQNIRLPAPVVGGLALLTAECRHDGDQYNHDGIDTDNFIGNNDGVLVWGGRGWSHTCREAHLSHHSDGVYLEALCWRADGHTACWSGLHLDDHISNDSGHLRLDGPPDLREEELRRRLRLR